MSKQINDTIFEEAKRCPRCGVPGKPAGTKPAPNGNGTLHFFMCDSSEACRFYHNGTYMVQTDITGAIPVKNTKQDKDFPVLPGFIMNRASSEIDELAHAPKDTEI